MKPDSISREYPDLVLVSISMAWATFFLGICYLLYSHITAPSPKLYVEYHSCVRSLADVQNETFPHRMSKVEHCRALVSDAPAISFWDEGTRYAYPAISR